MSLNEQLDHFIQQAKSLFPSGELSTELEKNLRALAQSHFSKLGVVSKEEFEAQTAVLHRTRQKLEDLEQQLEAISSK